MIFAQRIMTFTRKLTITHKIFLIFRTPFFEKKGLDNSIFQKVHLTHNIYFFKKYQKHIKKPVKSYGGSKFGKCKR